jgi:hypothetical protein
VTDTAKFDLEIGFDLDEANAGPIALSRWKDAVSRAGKKPATGVVMVMSRTEGLKRIGQFSVTVSGDVIDDD